MKKNRDFSLDILEGSDINTAGDISERTDLASPKEREAIFRLAQRKYSMSGEMSGDNVSGTENYPRRRYRFPTTAAACLAACMVLFGGILLARGSFSYEPPEEPSVQPEEVSPAIPVIKEMLEANGISAAAPEYIPPELTLTDSKANHNSAQFVLSDGGSESITIFFRLDMRQPDDWKSLFSVYGENLLMNRVSLNGSPAVRYDHSAPDGSHMTDIVYREDDITVIYSFVSISEQDIEKMLF